MTDTIAAVATPPGPSPRAILRLSGVEAIVVAARVFTPRSGGPLAAQPSFRWIEGTVRWEGAPGPGSLAPAGLILMRAPKSYTREEMAELHVPGNPVLVGALYARILAAGARSAEPGEFTRRAFENGRLDLTQAEAVLGVIDAERGEDHRRALALLGENRRTRATALRESVAGLLALLEGSLDFAEEGIDFFQDESLPEQIRYLRETLSAAAADSQVPRGDVAAGLPRLFLVGKANAGKSTLFNSLVQGSGALPNLESPVAGTTRDMIEAEVSWPLGNRAVAFILVDTPGFLGEAAACVDETGHKLLAAALAGRPFVLFVADGGRPWEKEDGELYERCRGLAHRVVIAKGDLPRRLDWVGVVEPEAAAAALTASARTGAGIPELQKALAEWMVDERRSDPARAQAAEGAIYTAVGEALDRAWEEARQGGAPELVAASLREAVEGFSPLFGPAAPEEMLDRIFGKFCIGK